MVTNETSFTSHLRAAAASKNGGGPGHLRTGAGGGSDTQRLPRSRTDRRHGCHCSDSEGRCRVERLRPALPGHVQQAQGPGVRVLQPRGGSLPLDRDAHGRGSRPRAPDDVRGHELPHVDRGDVRQDHRRLGPLQQDLGHRREVLHPAEGRPADEQRLQGRRPGDLRPGVRQPGGLPGAARRLRGRRQGPHRQRAEVGLRRS
jgi:hypothetical protein